MCGAAHARQAIDVGKMQRPKAGHTMLFALTVPPLPRAARTGRGGRIGALRCNMCGAGGR
ncbi:hypothetical protein BWR18_19530 (plasmid) [Tateyamaria omphalii]|uniref:Uncharacterized protein n=1 Tax=Tateyamaria omphalii TaxID=299262 RepID=A0A1P8N153_9RHOB|nr:hypothetical protein BWR18_19530 [Tateyamaria omphalii]